MRRRRLGLGSVLAVATGVFVATAPTPQCASRAHRAGAPASSSCAARHVTLPLVFEENGGQTDPCVRFLARAPEGTFFVTPRETVLRLRAGVLRSRFVGARPSPEIVAEEPLEGRANYLIGNDPSKWRTDVPMCGRVRARGVYEGVDVAWYGREGRLEYDVLLAPGADPSQIEIAFDGADACALDARGDLVLSCGGATVVERRPLVWQEAPEGRRDVACRFLLDGSHVRFALDGLDPTLPAVIDPFVIYGSFLGGDGNEIGRGIFRDGDITYVCGNTTSSDFPHVNATQATYAGTGQFGDGDGFVAKIDTAGAGILFSTYLGGSQDDRLAKVAVDSLGNVCLTGQSYSDDFPTSPGALQAAHAGQADCVVVKLAPSGSSFVFSTYLGGGSDDSVVAMVVGPQDDLYITGQAAGGFPTTLGAFQATLQGPYDAYVAKVKADGTALLYSTMFGGNGEDRTLCLAVDAAGNAVAAGYTRSTDLPLKNAYQAALGGDYDAFVLGVNPSGTDLLFSTYLGGNGADFATGIALGTSNQVYVVGVSASTDLAPLAGIQAGNAGGNDVLWAEFSESGTAVHVTQLGGSGDDVGEAIAVQQDGVVWLGGCTASPDFPILPGAAQPALGGGQDGFFARIAPDHLALDYSTYAGGTDEECIFALTVDPDGTPWSVGYTSSGDFPATAGSSQTTKAAGRDVFLSTPPRPKVVSPPAIDSFFLPKRVVAKANAKDASKSKLTVAGFFDTGSGSPDVTAAATLTIGTTDFTIPSLTAAADGRHFTYVGQGLRFLIVKNAFGSSRAKFKLTRVGDLAGIAPQNGDLTLHFENPLVDGRGELKLTAGRFALGRIRGALVAPNLFVVKAAARIKGAGKDSLSLLVGLATDGTTPAASSDLHVKFGALDATIPADQFVKSGDRFVFKGNVGGVTNVTLDYLRETITIKAKNASLGSYVDGANVVEIDVAFGTDSRAVRVKTAKKGTVMKY